jgi:uncharacterized protein (DUF2236 family)
VSLLAYQRAAENGLFVWATENGFEGDLNSSHATRMSAYAVENEPFVKPGSIVRRIWGDVDLVLLVFAAAAAEFALNRAVDWLFVTGELPSDPIGRLITTAAYSQRIALSDRGEAQRALAAIRAAHERVEQRRGDRIPDWAHRDVLYLLIDHSERAFRALHRPLTPAEQRDLYAVFRQVGEGLHIPELPANYGEWRADRERHVSQDLAFSPYTSALYGVYKRELGWWRYALLLQVQAVLAPERVRQLLALAKRPWIRHLLPLYGVLARLSLRNLVQRLLIPPAHLDAVRSLERDKAAT